MIGDWWGCNQVVGRGSRKTNTCDGAHDACALREWSGRLARRAVVERWVTARHANRPNKLFCHREPRTPFKPSDRSGASPYQARLIPTGLKIPSPGLLSFQRFKQRLEIARAEPFAAVPTDNFIKYRWPILNGLAENLEQISFFIPVYKNPAPA